MGFEPTNPCGTGASVLADMTIDWESFEKWLLKEYKPIYAKDLLLYAKKFSTCLIDMNLSDLMLTTESQKKHAMPSLSNLSKFLGIYEDFKKAIKNYGLKWGSNNGDDLIIERLTKITNPNEIYDWVKAVKTSVPELSPFMDLVTTTGIRYNEAIESYNLIIALAREGNLDNYFNADKNVLEHFRYKDKFIRKSKKVFVSFVPKEIIQNIANSEPIEWAHTKKVVILRTKRLRFGDIREFWGSYMTRHLSQPEIDFLQGRVSTSVFMKNYFNITWIEDLKDRVLEKAKEILKRL